MYFNGAKMRSRIENSNTLRFFILTVQIFDFGQTGMYFLLVTNLGTIHGGVN